MKEIKINKGYKNSMACHNSLAKLEKWMIFGTILVTGLKLGSAVIADYYKKKK